jgi:hypothetical protein
MDCTTASDGGMLPNCPSPVKEGINCLSPLFQEGSKPLKSRGGGRVYQKLFDSCNFPSVMDRVNVIERAAETLLSLSKHKWLARNFTIVKGNAKQTMGCGCPHNCENRVVIEYVLDSNCFSLSTSLLVDCAEHNKQYEVEKALTLTNDNMKKRLTKDQSEFLEFLVTKNNKKAMTPREFQKSWEGWEKCPLIECPPRWQNIPSVPSINQITNWKQRYDAKQQKSTLDTTKGVTYEAIIDWCEKHHAPPDFFKTNFSGSKTQAYTVGYRVNAEKKCFDIAITNHFLWTLRPPQDWQVHSDTTHGTVQLFNCKCPLFSFGFTDANRQYHLTLLGISMRETHSNFGFYFDILRRGVDMPIKRLLCDGAEAIRNGVNGLAPLETTTLRATDTAAVAVAETVIVTNAETATVTVAETVAVSPAVTMTVSATVTVAVSAAETATGTEAAGTLAVSAAETAKVTAAETAKVTAAETVTVTAAETVAVSAAESAIGTDCGTGTGTGTETQVPFIIWQLVELEELFEQDLMEVTETELVRRAMCYPHAKRGVQAHLGSGSGSNKATKAELKKQFFLDLYSVHHAFTKVHTIQTIQTIHTLHTNQHYTNT